MMSVETSKDSAIRKLGERIYKPAVRRVFDKYVNSGCLDEYLSLLGTMQDGTRSMVVEAGSSQVHKEKSVIPYLVAQRYGFDLERAAVIGASTEVLWGLSTVFDDIFDNDHTRNDDPAIWVQKGKHMALKMVSESLASTFTYLEENVGENSGVLAKAYVNEGLDSVKQHALMGLTTPKNEILFNYRMRDGFHTYLPVELLTDWEGRELGQEKSDIMMGMTLFNQAGQIANDTSDLRANKGPARFNDLREGRVTIAMIALYNRLGTAEQLFLNELFGSQREFTTEEREKLGQVIEGGYFVSDISRRIVDTYQRSSEILSRHLLPEGKSIIKDWIDYKTEKYV